MLADQLTRAFTLMADPEWGGSLDYDPPARVRMGARRTPKSGVPYTYQHGKHWQVRLPGCRPVYFALTADGLAAARAYVAERVEL